MLYGQLFFSSSILMAWPWLAVVGLLLVGYYAAYWQAHRHAALGQAAARVALSIAATFLIIGFLFVNNLSLLQNPHPMHLHRPDEALLCLRRVPRSGRGAIPS